MSKPYRFPIPLLRAVVFAVFVLSGCRSQPLSPADAETKREINALVEQLKDTKNNNSDVRLSAIESLRSATRSIDLSDPVAKEIVPALTVALNDQSLVIIHEYL